MGVFSYIRCSFLLIFCHILFTGPKICLAVTEVDVLILGAGISGISAGSFLHSNGQTNFLILEAQDYIGGRVKQVKIGDVTVGDGANWVHYVEDNDENPMLGIAKEINLTRYPMNMSDFSLRNSIHKNEDMGKTFKTIAELTLKIIKQNENNPRSGDLPLSSALAQHGWLPDTALKRTTEWSYFDFEYGVKPALISYRHFSGVPAENDIITDKRGFKGIIDYLSQNFTGKIKTDNVVTQIKFNTSNGIEVRTKDGETFRAKYGLCTFSTGVLASDLVEFEPELPQWKKEAISRIPLAYYTNTFVKFPSAFWDDSEFILNAGSLTETFPVVYNINKKGIHEGSNVLLFTAVDENSLRIESQGKNETIAEVMKTLREMYPNVSIPEPTEISVSRFSQNPYIRGSFSNAVVGSTSADFNNLQGRLGNLFFSGEAASEDYWGYTQGGYLTGLKQAKVIHSCLNGGECPAYEPENSDICKTKKNVPSSASNDQHSLACVFLFILCMLCN